ncbi:DUF721 domain-containing protein [Candidatus Persebacteraceae bacterium Df01]|jgi:hypothetical protein|uniref:DUF721 domain-containing protein n=1 Tax=Candidatus Doriopsillibacter californiensis TaxID=2970740 RepID=A0ABT7QN98_9GAMM|nr:DUF721 domain-containing protein [Candidatus Persebacteraceae bacterium Df01]
MKKISDILADNVFTQYRRQADTLSQLEQAVQRAIVFAGGEGLRCRVFSFASSELCLVAASTADAARLRQMLPSVTRIVSSEFPHIEKTRINIQP